MLGDNSEPVSKDTDMPGPSIDEVKNIRGRLSLKLLNTLDPVIDTILHQTPFVTGYSMTSDHKWSRMGIEGFLYVVKRVQNPTYSFILVNKKSEGHLIEYLTPEFQMNKNGNYIFYRSLDIKTKKLNLMKGLWFFDENECKLTYQKLKDIVNNKSPLQFSLKSLDELKNNLCEPPLERELEGSEYNERTADKKDLIKEETSLKFKDMAAMIMDKLTFKGGSVKQDKNEEKDETSQGRGYLAGVEEENQSLNLEGKHLMTLLRSSGKTAQEETEEDEDKNLQQFQFKESEPEGEQVLKKEDSKITVTYEKLKSVMEEVAQSGEFMSLVWEKLKKHTEGS